jgi:glycosyltransferase involved in cell wall biosynthesis
LVLAREVPQDLHRRLILLPDYPQLVDRRTIDVDGSRYVGELRWTTARMKIGILTGSLSRSAGGTFEAVRCLARELHRQPATEVSVFGLKDAEFESDLPAWGSVPVAAFPVRGPRSFGFAGDLYSAIGNASIDLLHVHGLWMYPSVAACLWQRDTGAPRVISPHGMLDPWALANAGWKKKFATLLYEGRHLRHGACIHALCEAEVAAIRAFGLHNPVCLIPNGITPTEGPAPELPAWRRDLPVNTKILLYLGRLHPKKGLRNLLMAWAEARRSGNVRGREWNLILAGWDQDGHREELETLAAELNLGTSIRFIGPQFNEDKEAAYLAADAFILPSVSEGLPVVVLEAWAHRLPVLMTPECNLEEGFSAGAALRVDPKAQSIAQGLLQLFSMSTDRRCAMGNAGLRLVLKRFTWSRVSAEMKSVYGWLLGIAPRPDCVRMN